MRKELKINRRAIDSINAFLTSDDNPVITDVMKILDQYGGVKAINNAASVNGTLERLTEMAAAKNPRYGDELAWLAQQASGRKFVSMEEFKKGAGAPALVDGRSYPVTLEITKYPPFPAPVTTTFFPRSKTSELNGTSPNFAISLKAFAYKHERSHQRRS